MVFVVLALIALLPLKALAAPVQALASSTAVASSGAHDGNVHGYAQSFATSGSNNAAAAVAGGAASSLSTAYGENPFLNTQLDTLSSSQSISGASSSSSSQDSDWLTSGSSSGVENHRDTDAREQITNTHSISSQGEKESRTNVQDQRTTGEILGAGAASSEGLGQNQGTNENHGIGNLKGRIVHYAQSGPVIHVVTTGNDNSVEAFGNNQGSGSTNAAGAVANEGQVGYGVSQGLANSESSWNDQQNKWYNKESDALDSASSSSGNHGANSDSLAQANLATAGTNVGQLSGSQVVLANKNNGGAFQNISTKNSSSSSSSSSSHSESQSSSSSSSTSNMSSSSSYDVSKLIH